MVTPAPTLRVPYLFHDHPKLLVLTTIGTTTIWRVNYDWRDNGASTIQGAFEDAVTHFVMNETKTLGSEGSKVIVHNYTSCLVTQGSNVPRASIKWCSTIGRIGFSDAKPTSGTMSGELWWLRNVAPDMSGYMWSVSTPTPTHSPDWSLETSSKRSSSTKLSGKSMIVRTAIG
jgi:hypothetical protein